MELDTVIQNYKHGNLLGSIKEALTKMNVSPKDVTIEMLGPVDEFHIGGRVATAHLIERLNFERGDTVLDVGCGLGGASRYVAHTYNCKVRGVDLSEEYVTTGTTLNEWVSLQDKVHLSQGSVLDLPFSDTSFEGAYQIHVGMNIKDKKKLFAEIFRVLKPGATFGIFDIMAVGTDTSGLTYPMPWASDSTISHLASPETYQSCLKDAGFDVVAVEIRKDFALDFFKKMKAKTEEMGGPPPLGLHTLMQKGTPMKLQNMIKGVADNIIAPVEIVCKKYAD